MPSQKKTPHPFLPKKTNKIPQNRAIALDDRNPGRCQSAVEASCTSSARAHAWHCLPPCLGRFGVFFGRWRAVSTWNTRFVVICVFGDVSRRWGDEENHRVPTQPLKGDMLPAVSPLKIPTGNENDQIISNSNLEEMFRCENLRFRQGGSLNSCPSYENVGWIATCLGALLGLKRLFSSPFQPKNGITQLLNRWTHHFGM